MQSSIFLQFFGTPLVKHKDGRSDTFRSAKGVALLAYLLLEPGEHHGRNSLATLLWAEQGDLTARRNLAKTLTRLRGDLGVIGEALFESDRQLVQLNKTAAFTCDISEFESKVGQSKTHLHESLSTCSECQVALHEAVTLAGGRMLEGLELRKGAEQFEEWLLLKRESLHEQQLYALAALAEGAKAQAEFTDMASFARRQLELEAWRESAHQQLLLALAKSGDRPAALAQFEQCKQVLQSELGVAPSAKTLELVEQIRSNRLPNAVERRVAVQARLPGKLLPFFGRELLLKQIVERLHSAESRVISILGQGGIGKTSLALEAARRVAASDKASVDEIYFVPLVGVDSAELIPDAIASTLGIKPAANEPLADVVIEILSTRRALLVLDNFEHLSSGVSWLVTLLQAASQVQLLITSRERPNMLSQDSFQIFGLAVPPIGTDLAQATDFAASRLFLDRARRQYKPFRLDEAGWPLVIELCQRLEGLPLGIELASTLIGELPLPTLVDSLADDIDLLETDLDDIAAHQRSIRAVFEQSWQRLSDREQQSLARLSVMRGTFSAAAARAVAQTTPLLLRRLRHQSLLRSTTAGMYDIHELIRQFSAEKRHADRDLDQLSKQVHAEWYLQLVGRYPQEVLKEPAQQVQKRILQELGNVRAAWRWAGEQGLIALLAPAIDGLADYYTNATNPVVGVQQLAMVRNIVEEIRPNPTAPMQRLVAHLMIREASILANHGDRDRAIRLLQTALTSLTESDAPRLSGIALYNLGRLMLHLGDNQSAFDYFSEGHRLAEISGDRALTATCIRDLGNIHRQRGEYLPFLDHLHQARAIHIELGDKASEQNLLIWLGIYTAEMGDYHEGRRWLDKAWEQQSGVGTLYTEASILGALGRCDELFGEYSSAIEQQQLAVQKLRKLNSFWRLCLALVQMASALASAGRYVESAHQLTEAETLATENKLVELAGMIHTVSSYALFAQDRMAEAEDALRVSIECWMTVGRDVSLAESRILLARILLHDGRREEAHALLQQVLAFCDVRPIHGAWHYEKMVDNLQYVKLHV